MSAELKIVVSDNPLRGCVVSYPPGGRIGSHGAFVDNGEIAREIAEAYCRDGSICLPNERDENGNRLWDIVDPSAPNRQPSAMVHIHEDLYIDAACVKLVMAIDGPRELNGPACVAATVWIGDQGKTYYFAMPDFATAQIVSREITERINSGRFAMIVRTPEPLSPERAKELQDVLRDECLRSHPISPSCFSGGIWANTQGVSFIGQSDDMIEAATGTRPTEECTCTTARLMAGGCECGAMAR